MKYKVGIFGAAAGDLGSVLPKAGLLANELAKHKDDIILLTGAGPGLPYEIAKQTSGSGMEVWGFSPAHDLQGQKESTPAVETSVFNKFVFLPKDLQFVDNVLVGRKYRNVTSTATCDAAIIIAGRWGSLNEFTNLMDMQKTVGVLTGTGGIADELPELCRKITKEGQGTVIFDNDPDKLVNGLLARLKSL